MPDALIDPAPVLPPLEIETPIQINLQTIYLGGIFFLSLLAACYVAGEIILPIILAFILKLVFQPVMRTMDKARFPKMIASLSVILILLGGFAMLGAALSVPASNWSRSLPNDIAKLQHHLDVFRAPLNSLQKIIHRAENLAVAPDPKATTTTTIVTVQDGDGLSSRVLKGTQDFASGFFEMLLILFFLLLSGDTFLRRLIEILPRWRDKRQAVEISQQIERDVAAYLATITVMNLAVGIATFVIMLVCGVEDPLLWGTLAFLLNYVPIIGPIIATFLFAVVGLLSTLTLPALLPAGLYFIVHLIEGEVVTPMLLARRFTLNPVLVILSLVFWYWMWGIPGAVLATPMLAIVKIICDRIQSLKPLGHFIEG